MSQAQTKAVEEGNTPSAPNTGYSGELYYVCWLAIATGKTGRGTCSFPREEAKRYADELNMKNAGLTYHWIQREDETYAH